MKNTILVAGGTGNLGKKIVDALLKKEADVRVVVRKDGDTSKTAELETAGINVLAVDMMNQHEVADACSGVACVVSALQGLRDVIVDTQKVLLDAAIEAGVSRFIPSEYSVDFTKLPAGSNRNFDLRREFHQYLVQNSIAATSIFNGSFTNILLGPSPLFDSKNKTIGYWEGKADWKIDFTTMDDAAAFIAAAAMDANAPAKLNIASFQISPNELLNTVNQLSGSQFKLVNMGNLEDFAVKTKQLRAANPQGENELYPQWQGAQYIHDMFSAHNESLDNNRYPGLTWIDKNAFIKSL